MSAQDHRSARHIENFTLEEVEDVIKNRKNLLYLFQLSGKFTRLLSTPR